MFAQVEQLARHSVEDAQNAVMFALSTSNEFNHGDSGFSNRGRGEEMGFVQALAQALFKCTGIKQLSMI